MEQICITFAGCPGTSKSPIAQHLSLKLNLPILNNDLIRTEVREDRLSFDQSEYERRRDLMGREVMDSATSFIYDASIDRAWADRSTMLAEAGYKTFIISMDLSEGFIRTLFKAKDYDQFDHLSGWQDDHAKFLAEYNDVVGLHITDDTFADRFALSLNAVREWLAR